MKKSILITSYVIFCNFYTLFAQTSLLNEAKYWVWRDRFVNDFIVPGNCDGCGIVFNTRGRNWCLYPLNANPYTGYYYNGGFDIGDEGFQMGKYLIVLATEWRLLFNSGLPTDKTKMEIYYELKTIDRLDLTAEKYWTERYSPSHQSCSDCTEYPNGYQNGFMIRDDVFDNFLWYNDYVPSNYQDDAYYRYLYLNQGEGSINGKYQKQNIMLMHKSQTGNTILPLEDLNVIIRSNPIEDGYPSNGGFSGASAGLLASNAGITGPVEYSQDNYIGLLQGLIAVNQLVNSDIGHNEITSFSLYAKYQLDRIIHSIRDNDIGQNWLIENPVTGKCVKGVKWEKYLDDWWISEYCNAGGAEAGAFSNQFASIHNTYGVGTMSGQVFNTGLLHSLLNNSTGKSEKFLCALLLTEGGNGTLFNFDNHNACNWINELNNDNEYEYQYLDLLYCYLHGGSPERDFDHYDKILNNTSCGNVWYDALGPQFENPMSYNMGGNLLSEMIIHNLLKILRNEHYCININDDKACPVIIEHQVNPNIPTQENQWYSAQCYRVLESFNEINSSANISDFSGDPNSINPLSAPCVAIVSYIAGKKIHLKPGFKVINNAHFHAKIQDFGNCNPHEGNYDIFNLPYNIEYVPVDISLSSTSLKMFHSTNSTEQNAVTNTDINIFPNPFKDVLNVSTNDTIEYMLQICDVIGNNIVSNISFKGNIIVNLEPYSGGVYIIKLFDLEGVLISTKKICHE